MIILYGYCIFSENEYGGPTNPLNLEVE